MRHQMSYKKPDLSYLPRKAIELVAFIGLSIN
jgi:hypothetical protein